MCEGRCVGRLPPRTTSQVLRCLCHSPELWATLPRACEAPVLSAPRPILSPPPDTGLVISGDLCPERPSSPHPPHQSQNLPVAFFQELGPRIGEADSKHPCHFPPGTWVFCGIPSPATGEKAARHTCPQMLTCNFLWPKIPPQGQKILHLGPQVRETVPCSERENHIPRGKELKGSQPWKAREARVSGCGDTTPTPTPTLHAGGSALKEGKGPPDRAENTRN